VTSPGPTDPPGSGEEHGHDRLVGRYSREIAPRFIDFAGVTAGPVLDVGCGPGPLTAALAACVGAARVAAVDPSSSLVAACRQRVAGADVCRASAEALPFAAGAFRSALSQLVLPSLRDADRAAAELARVVGRGGTVAACTFEANGLVAVRAFWNAALRFDPAAPEDPGLPFGRGSELVALWRRARLRDVEGAVIDVAARYSGFEDLWASLGDAVGPTGAYLAAQPEPRRAQIREACFELLGSPRAPFTLGARVLAVRGST